MDKRTKKRIAGLKTKLDTLGRKLKGARAQEDEPGEVARIEAEIASVQEELARLRGKK